MRSGEASEDAIVADVTLSVGAAKTGLLMDQATPYVGRLAVLPLAELTSRMEPDAGVQSVATPTELQRLLPRRKFDSHKGDYGRIGIVAGSRGLVGAAVLCGECLCARRRRARDALRDGGDLPDRWEPPFTPEVMVRPIDGLPRTAGDTRRDVLALGPGLGQDRPEEVLELIRRCEQPMIIDADGLNMLATSPDVLRRVRRAAPADATPRRDGAPVARHGGTDSAGTGGGRGSATYPGTLLLKGSRTVIAETGRPVSYNTTGNAGARQRRHGRHAHRRLRRTRRTRPARSTTARASAAWLCGHAAELAIAHGGESEESLIASRVVGLTGAGVPESASRSFLASGPLLARQRGTTLWQIRY